MGDSVKKYFESTSTSNVKAIYPGGIEITEEKSYIYESPDGGKTVTRRPFGADIDQREVISTPQGQDIYVQLVKAKFEERSQAGIKKYNTTLEREDLNLVDWLNHLQEELMDATLYVEKLKAIAKENS